MAVRATSGEGVLALHFSRVGYFGRRSSGWLPAALIVIAGVLAPCGSASATSSGAISPALARIRSSVGHTEAAGSAHFVTQAVTGLTVNGRTKPTQHISTTGDVQFDGARVSLTTQVMTPGSTPPPASEQIAIGKTYYVREGPSAKWSKGKTKQNYPFLGVLEPAGLVSARGPVRMVGPKVMGGQPSTEYALAMAAETHALKEPGGKTTTLRIRPYVLNIWLDGKGRIVATRATVSTSEGLEESVRSTTTTHLSDFGEPLDIKAPAS